VKFLMLFCSDTEPDTDESAWPDIDFRVELRVSSLRTSEWGVSRHRNTVTVAAWW